MKIKTVFFCIILNFVCLSAFSNSLFWHVNGVAVAQNNTVQFYSFENGAWKTDPSLTLSLPGGFSNIFSIGIRGVVAVAQNNTVQFYSFENDAWNIDPSLTLSLSGGYSDIFALLSGDIAVVRNNTVQFYSFENGAWKIDNSLTFTLK